MGVPTLTDDVLNFDEVFTSISRAILVEDLPNVQSELPARLILYYVLLVTNNSNISFEYPLTMLVASRICSTIYSR